MKTIKILNLYACLGGNRYKWDEVAKEAKVNIQVTAIELDSELARMYKERFPNDKVIITDAHEYLLQNYKGFDFIWSSPPCPSHSRARFWNSSNYDTKTEAVYPSMELYQEIIFLQNYFKGSWIVENVIPYYKPLIEAKKIGRHLFWSNFKLLNIEETKDNIKICAAKNEREVLQVFHEIDLSVYKGKQPKTKIARNLVDFRIGRQIFERYLGIEKAKNTNQVTIFDVINKKD